MAIPTSELYNLVSRHLNNINVVVSQENEWFKQCVDFFKFNDPNATISDLSVMVREQLSLADFKQIALSSLPANINSKENIVLNGKFCLQVNEIINVGQSCYSQYNIILKKDISNSEINDSKIAVWEPTLHRILKMSCTDGQQDIFAMEYEPLICLKEPFVPGFKITIIGPVEFRKGVLLLKSKNVHFIGGEVDHMLISNAPLNVLCRSLQKPELENPYAFSDIEVEKTVEQNLETENNFSRNNMSNQNKRNEHVINPISNSNLSDNYSHYEDFMDDDEEDDLLCLSQITEIESHIIQTSNITEAPTLSKELCKTTQKSSSNCNDNFSISINTNTNKSDKTNENIQLKQNQITDIFRPSHSKSNNLTVNSVHKFNTSTDTNNSSNAQVTGKREASGSPLQAQTKRPSLEYKVADKDLNISNTELFVNSNNKIFNSVKVVKLSKIQVKQSEWICSGTIICDSKQEDVEFSPLVLESLIGISSHEVVPLRENPSKYPLLKEKIEKGIKGAERKLYLYNGKMTLKYFSNEKKPIVISLDCL
ncbi:recQ-mediated genome instability protein 1-like isoform X2 [Daktulosphaira vitifoliae]|uniref:recQ-mediated genome instability protein 1-like isoform X2 n=1 Tax=Daktulosphaira vitifoliae TaxID=58002 RepID=UPI0021A9D98D|nr:recQ-mediated genome instability protein 1-like isoform X2 [Daktulosphaira vitifoliae]